MRILVCGCRTWHDARTIERAMFAAAATVIIHGDAAGADTIAGRIATELHGTPVEVYPAKWDTLGRAAGPIRNTRMLVEGKPDLVLAFWDGESRGTLDMIKQATAAGVPVRITPRSTG